jgi:histidinol-phosphate aminotransferase
MNISQLVRKQIRKMEEINWGDIPDNTGSRLLWGENQKFLKIYREAVEKEIEKINLYPSPTKQILKKELARYNDVKPENIIPTNGSDEALELIAKVFISENDEIIMPIPSYPCFGSVSQMMGAKIVTVPLEKNFSLKINSLLKAVTKKTKIIWIANPNNPTGNLLLNKKQIELIAKKVNCLLVVDECYFELGGVTGASLIERYPNLIVVRSFSKIFALAGARLGYLICSKEAAAYLNRLQQTNQVFCVNRFAQAAGISILRQPQLITDSMIKFQSLKNTFEEKLKRLTQLNVLKTKTTFCLVKILSTKTAKQLKEQLGENNIFIKDCSMYEGLGKQFMYLGIPQKKYQTKIIKTINRLLEE